MNKAGSSILAPKFKVGDVVGNFTIRFYDGHSCVNKRTAKTMAKAQHWYYCKCSCEKTEHRSQQELTDPRRNQMCSDCRKAHRALQILNKE